MKLYFTLITLFIFGNVCIAQTSLQGTLRNEAGQPIAGAFLRLLNTNYSTLSDSNGIFRFDLPTGDYTIHGSATGYADYHKLMHIQKGLNEIEILLIRNSKSLERIVITAQKKEELLQQAPVSVTALSGKQAEEYRLWNINDLSAIASNLYISDPGDNRNVTSIRGIANTSYDQAVTTYVDGVNQFNLDTYIPHLFDVERIEILKGPQGTLYGRNSMGGVINIITRKPGNRTGAFAELSYGNYGQQRYNAGFRTPIIKDHLFFGVAGLYDRSNGVYTNQFNNSHYDKKSSVTGNYYLRFTPDQKWSFTINTKHSHNRNNGPFPLVFGAEEALSHPYQLNQNAITKMIDDVFNTSLSINYFSPSIHLSSQTAYQSNHRYYISPIDADFSPIDAITIINDYGDDWNKVKVLTQEINLRSNSTVNRLKWLTGGYFFHQKNPVKQTTRFGEQAQLTGAPDKNFSLINSGIGEGCGIAFYGQLSYALSKKVEFTAGLRYDHENKEQQVLGEYQKDPDPNPVFAYRSDTMATVNFSAWSPKLTLAYYSNDDQTFYGSYSRGFRAGGLTPLSSDPSQPALFPFLPEFSNNAEIGWKQTLWNQKLIFNIALFHTIVTDVQVPTLVMPDAVTITRNTGKLISKGIEAELRSQVFKTFRIDYSFGFTDAHYTDLKISQGGNEIDLRGKRQLFTPDITSMLAAQFVYPVGNRKNTNLIVRGEWKFLGKQYFDLANTIGQSSYHLLNTRFGVQHDKIEIMFWGRNLTNKRFISYAYDFGAVHLGDPRMYGITTHVKI